MNIIIVSQNYYPDNFAINEITEGLVKRGHKVTVLTGLPDYTTSEIPEEYKHGQNRRQKLFGANVIRVATVARKHGPIWRSLNYISFVISGLLIVPKLAKNIEFDCIYVWQVSPVTMAIPAIALKKRTNKPLFLYCLDLWPESVKAMGFKEGTFLYKVIHIISRWIYSKCDHIAVSSEPFIDYLESINGISRDKISYLPQFASTDFLNLNLHKEPNGHVDFLYVGNIGKAQDMSCLIRAISRIKERNNVTFHIVGGGSEYENTVSLARETGAISIMKFYGPVPIKESVKYYKNTDACVITLDGTSHIGDTLPGKVQTYMAAGKPILGAMNGAGNQVINQSGAGECVSAGDSDGLANLFLKFIDEPSQYKECGQEARTFFIENFTEKKHFQELENTLESMQGAK